MTVSPSIVLAGATVQTFIFDFLNDDNQSFNSSSAVLQTIPSGWTAPQNTNTANPGFVTVAEGTGSGTNTCDPGTVTISGSGPWTITVPQTCGSGDHLTITYGAGTSPVKVTVPATVTTTTFTTQTRDGSTVSRTSARHPALPAVAVDTFSSSALTTPKTTFAPGESVFLRVHGIPTSTADFTNRYIAPGSGVNSANDVGSGRPDTDSSGNLPTPTNTYLQYPPFTPNPTNWNDLDLYEDDSCPRPSRPRMRARGGLGSSGGNVSGSVNAFTLSNTPVVTAVAPNSGPTGGGTKITLTGTGFTGATAVTFGGTNATGDTVDNARRSRPRPRRTAPAGLTCGHDDRWHRRELGSRRPTTRTRRRPPTVTGRSVRRAPRPVARR